MAHDLLGNRFAGTESAWHLLGKVNESYVSSLQAAKDTDQLFTIHKTPLMAVAPDGTQIPTTVFGLLREPVADDNEWVTLGTCGGDYDYWQNEDVCERVDMLIAQTGWKFATVGTIARGATLFISLDMGKGDIGGEEYNRFFTLIETRDGKTRSHGIVSRIRVVCKNTCDLALRNASGRISIRHDQMYKPSMDWAMSTIAEAHKSGASVDEALNQLTKITMDDERMNAVLNAVAPMPEYPTILTMDRTSANASRYDMASVKYERAQNATARVRDTLMSNYADLNDNMPANLRGTGMAAFQSVTAYTSHQHGTLGARGRKMDVQSRAEFDLIGDGQKMRNAAYSAIVE
jgi:hypothetical protein